MTTAITHLERLVGFATVSRDSNLDLIEYVRAELAGLGIHSEIVASDDGRKANLFATIGPANRPGVVLSGTYRRGPGRGPGLDVRPVYGALR
jgi:acetylornithine deacetylase